MKTLVTHSLIGLICIIATAWILWNTWPTERCAKIMAEERAGWIASMSTLNQVMQAQNDQLYRANRDLEARAIQQQAEHTKLQQEFGKVVATQIGKIDDVWAMQVPLSWDSGPADVKIRWKSSATSEPITDISSRMVAVEQEVASIKEVAATLSPMEAQAKEQKVQAGDTKSYFTGIWKEMRGQTLKLAAKKW